MTKAASQTASPNKWVIGWFLEGFGPGWISTARMHLLPWTGDLAKAMTFDSAEDADRTLIQWELLDLHVGDTWVEQLDKNGV